MQTNKIFCHLTDYGLLKVGGQDAKKLLHGQLTCDVEKLNPGGSCMGAHCNPQGRILSLFYLFRMQDAYFLLMPRDMISIALAALKKYAVFYKTELSDVSDHFVIEGMSHEDRDAISACSQSITLPSPASRAITVSEKTGLDKPRDSLNTIDQNAWKRLDIHDGIPAVYPQTSGKFLPQELNLTLLGAVSFEKGCYTGQEIIARMHYRGKLKTELCQAKIAEIALPAPGSDIHFLSSQNTPVTGTLVDICEEEYNTYYALIMTRK